MLFRVIHAGKTMYFCLMEERTEIESLGEFGLIDRLTKGFRSKRGETVMGIGDDAAVIGTGKDRLLVSTDALLEGVHFDLTYTPLKHLGYKAVMVNISDICAMNGEPTHVTVSIGVSNRFSVEALEELYSGIEKACENYRVDLIGGDTTSSRSGLFLSVTALGKAREEDVCYRKGASEKELIVTSGDLGAAYMGLQVLEREKAVFKEAPGVQPDLSGHDYILERQLKPEARVDIRQILANAGIKPTSMIDISDGLASEVFHLCKASGTGAVIYEEKLPIEKNTYKTAKDFGLDPTTCALNGGEDYELLFTIRQEDFEKIKDDPNFSIVGYMKAKDEGYHLVDKNGGQHNLKAQGWDSFQAQSE